MGNDRLINFCHPKLSSTVSCNTCSSENYEETNLLSPDPIKLGKGFMADRFIKPPVEIQVTFKYAVKLSHILLWPRVGQQKSTGFEVISSFIDRNSSMTERIGSCYLSDDDDGVSFFYPQKFGRGNQVLDSPQQAKFARRSFSWQKISAISNVKSITIKIVRTNSSAVPALGRIEIWGQPGFYTSQQEKRDVWQLWDQQLNEIKPPLKHAQQPCAMAGTSKQSTLPPVSLDIPEEFLDGLTFEMMSVPMVLPSGKVVDQRTLERHQDSEANWGRPPSDPFTGRPFTATIHPILDTVLKSRIDHFLVVHQDRDELRFVPRTLGRKHQNTAKNLTSNLLPQKLNSNHQSCLNRDLFSSTPSVQTTSNTKISSSSRKRAPSPESTVIFENVKNKNMKMENKTVGPALKPNSCRFNNDDDLDDALKAVLSGLPSYLNTEKAPPSTPDHCCRCKSYDNLFKLPCDHLICRICLLTVTKNAQPSCDICKSNFTSSQPVKYHPV